MVIVPHMTSVCAAGPPGASNEEEVVSKHGACDCKCEPSCFTWQIRCDCTHTCQRVGKCPCKTAGVQCTERCMCGAGKREPCKNKLASQPRQTFSFQQQFADMEDYYCLGKHTRCKVSYFDTITGFCCGSLN